MSKTVHFKRPALYRIVIFALWYGSGSGGSKRLIFKGRACTESSYWGFGTGPGFGEVQNGSFIQAALVQNRHFWALALVTACQVMSRRVTSRLVASCRVMPCHVMSYHGMSRHVTSRHVRSCHVMSRHVLSRVAIPCRIMACHDTSCHVTSCHVMLCRVMSCHVMPCMTS